MNKNTANKINGGMAIYYGIASLIAAVSVAIGVIVWLFKVFNDKADFSWGALIGLTALAIVSGSVGYLILRIGYEEIEK